MIPIIGIKNSRKGSRKQKGKKKSRIRRGPWRLQPHKMPHLSHSPRFRPAFTAPVTAQLSSRLLRRSSSDERHSHQLSQPTPHLDSQRVQHIDRSLKKVPSGQVSSLSQLASGRHTEIRDVNGFVSTPPTGCRAPSLQMHMTSTV